MWNRLGKILWVIEGIIFAILYIIGAICLCLLWGISMVIGILLLIPMCIIWIITGKFYSGEMFDWMNRLMDKYFPF